MSAKGEPRQVHVQVVPDSAINIHIEQTGPENTRIEMRVYGPLGTDAEAVARTLGTMANNLRARMGAASLVVPAGAGLHTVE